MKKELLLCICLIFNCISLSGQLGLHIQNHSGFGLHYSSHPSHDWTLFAGLSVGFGGGTTKLDFWTLNAEVGAQYHFYRKENISTYCGLRVRSRIFRDFTQEQTNVNATADQYPMGADELKVANSLILPAGISLLLGDREQWAAFAEIGLEYNLNAAQLFHHNLFPHGRIGMTHFFHR